MRFLTIILLILFLSLSASLCSCNKGTEVTIKPDIGVEKKDESRIKDESQYKKEIEEIKKAIKSESKIKVKKDGKGAYTWEITGKDVHEILKINDILSKKLGD